VSVRPHGSSKQKEPYCCTNPSTLATMKSKSQHARPKATISSVYADKGGILNASNLGELSRNRQQVAHMRHGGHITSSLCSNKSTRDPLFMVMEQSKLQDGEDSFVRTVTACPEPMCLLTTNWQLDDLVHFCTNPDQFCVLSVDPTFTLRDFSVTCITYRNLLVAFWSITWTIICTYTRVNPMRFTISLHLCLLV